MSTRHIVHERLIPGRDGDGFTPPEASLVRSAVARVDPKIEAPMIGATIKHGPNGPDWAIEAVPGDFFSNPNDAITWAGSGGRVQFTGTDYDLEEPLMTLPYMTIEGSDAIRSHLRFAGAGESIIRARDQAAACNWVTLKNMRLNGLGQAKYGLDARGMTRGMFENIRIDSLGGGGAGVVFGGDFADHIGGWSNTFIKGEILVPAVGAGALFYGTVGGPSGPRTANNNTLFDVVINIGDTDTSIGVDLVQGDTNKIIGCDIGYSLGSTTPGGLPIMVRSLARDNRVLSNRTEAVAYSVLIVGGQGTVLTGNEFGGAHPTISPCRVDAGNKNAPNYFITNLYSMSARRPLVEEMSPGNYGTVIFEDGQLALSGQSAEMALSVLNESTGKSWQVRGDGRMLWPAPTDPSYAQTALIPDETTGGVGWAVGSIVRLPRVATLPTASVNYRGALIRLEGNPDKLYICEYTGTGYTWRQI